MIFETLVGREGDVRALLGLDDKLGSVDLSGIDWASRPVTLKKLVFRDVFFADLTMGVDFDSCVFESCHFLKVKSESHLWGVDNRWVECKFSEIQLRDVASPGNRFEGCEFDELSLVNYQVATTVFERCRFSESLVSGLRGLLGAGEGSLRHYEEKEAPSADFRHCEFENVVFRESYFENVSFGECRFQRTVAIDCDFSGVSSDVLWWAAQEADPFASFLVRLLAAVESELGPSCAATVALRRYVDAFVSGVTVSRDFSACLYKGNIPDHELDIVEDVVAKLIRTHPF